MPAPALPKPAAAAGDILKALLLIFDIAVGVVIGAAVWIAANTLYLQALWRPYIDDIFSNFDLVSQLPYLLMGAAFRIYANLGHKQLPKVVGTGLLCGSLGVFFLTAHQWMAETQFPQNLFLLGIALCFPAGIVAAFVERLIELRVADFGKSLGLTKGQDFGEWAGSALTCSLIIATAYAERPGRIGIAIIAAIIVASMVREWFDYRRTGRKSVELVRSIIILKIAGTVAALFAVAFLVGDYRQHMPLTEIAGLRGPLIAAIFSALAIPTYLIAYRGSEKQRLLDFCHTVSAFWGIGAFCGWIAAGWVTAVALAIASQFKTEVLTGPYGETAAVWSGFTCCLVVLLRRYQFRRLAQGIILGTYTAFEIIKTTFATLLAASIFGFFALCIAASSRTDLHVFHPVTWEDRMYLGIFLGITLLIAFGFLEWYAEVTQLVLGPLDNDPPPPGGRSKPFEDDDG